jgi:restriction system protein
VLPDYQSIILPLLTMIKDREEHNIRDLIERLAEQFQLTTEERQELLPSGQQPVFDNRVGWARTYLKKAGLIASTRRAHLQITDQGINVINQHPSQINNQFLKQFEDFNDFFHSKKSENSTLNLIEVPVLKPTDIPISEAINPEEHLEYLITDLDTQLAKDLLERLKGHHFTFFENFVVQLLVKMGYGSSKKDIL